jgi:hypothetical protein
MDAQFSTMGRDGSHSNSSRTICPILIKISKNEIGQAWGSSIEYPYYHVSNKPIWNTSIAHLTRRPVTTLKPHWHLIKEVFKTRSLTGIDICGSDAGRNYYGTVGVVVMPLVRVYIVRVAGFEIVKLV